MTTDKECFEATAREIENGYGYLCADRMNDANRRMFADIIASALSAAFEDGRKAALDDLAQRRAAELQRVRELCGISDDAGKPE